MLCRFVLFCLSFHLTDVVKSVSVMEGDSVSLNADFTELKKDDLIMWNFKTDGPLIAKFDYATKECMINSDVLNGTFRHRLHVDNQTGSLTITDTRTTDSGEYESTINSKKKDSKRFNLSVYPRLPVPVIISESPPNSSEQYCLVVCSVANTSAVGLSWYKGNHLFSSINVSDLNNNIFLHLECLDGSYSCVVNNPISNLTKHLNITEHCQPCPDCTFCCHISEVIARLVLSALVGVVTVVVLAYELITSRNSGNGRNCR